MSKKRLDTLLVEKNLVENTDKAKRMVMAGLVFSHQERLDKPGMLLDENISLRIKGKKIPYVGRGGLKLEKALKHFPITVRDKVFMDVGSSTGGFTDCALQHEAKLSYAVDSGYNQLDWKLRQDKRVVVMERTNFRYVTKDMLQNGEPEFAAIDVSFISLKIILPVLSQLLAGDSDVVALIKPQFEAKKEQVESGGIVSNKAVHIEVLQKITAFAGDHGFQLLDLTHSPITGGEGNIEFLAYFGWKKEQEYSDSIDFDTIVKQAHAALR